MRCPPPGTGVGGLRDMIRIAIVEPGFGEIAEVTGDGYLCLVRRGTEWGEDVCVRILIKSSNINIRITKAGKDPGRFPVLLGCAGAAFINIIQIAITGGRFSCYTEFEMTIHNQVIRARAPEYDFRTLQQLVVIGDLLEKHGYPATMDT
jgi:hypothetical protein